MFAVHRFFTIISLIFPEFFRLKILINENTKFYFIKFLDFSCFIFFISYHSTLFRYENYSPSDYNLECLIDENKYFVVSPKDVVSASLYETDDRVKWLIEHE